MRTITKIAAIVVVIILFAAAPGSMFNYSALRHYRATARPGNFFLVEGRRMHRYCIGAGSPTVVIESGLGDDWRLATCAAWISACGKSVFV